MDFAIGKKAGQWEVAQCFLNHLYFFGIATKLITTTAQAGDIDAAPGCLPGYLLEAPRNIIQHVLHIIDRGLLITSAEDDLVALGKVIVYRKNIVIGINAHEIAYGVITFVAAWYTQANEYISRFLFQLLVAADFHVLHQHL